MGLLSFFERRRDPSASPAAANEPPDAVQRARTRARQRLIGAVVLVGVGIIGFPLVFETQPRPIPVDIPIELPAKDAAPPLAMPPARPGGNAAATLAASGALPAGVTVEPGDDAPAAASAPPPAAPASPALVPSAASPRVAAVAASAVPVADTPKAAPVAARPVAAVAEAPHVKPAAPPKPVPESKPVAHATSGRFVVQVGAFADAGAAQQMRLKAEKLGLKTYTQTASTAAGNRIRVRAGPYGTREEADKALAKARSGGLTAVVLTL